MFPGVSKRLREYSRQSDCLNVSDYIGPVLHSTDELLVRADKSTQNLASTWPWAEAYPSSVEPTLRATLFCNHTR